MGMTEVLENTDKKRGQNNCSDLFFVINSLIFLSRITILVEDMHKHKGDDGS